MKFFILIWFILMPLLSLAKVDLKVGDILLQPLHCRLCTLIESEENTIYSHTGVILQIHPEVLVGEAWINVKATPLTEYLKKTERGQKTKVIRFQNQNIINAIQVNAAEFWHIFKADFEGKKYDSEFLWNNFDENGGEMLYCSEFISKIFQAFMGLELPIKRMHFSQNREQWDAYFKGHTPVGQWGNSPGDFERSELFYDVGEL